MTGICRQRLPSRRDVENLAALMASPDGAFITAAVVAIDG